ncbi:MAG: DUF5916 domain-containing protein [Bacteroidota bacterium]
MKMTLTPRVLLLFALYTACPGLVSAGLPPDSLRTPLQVTRISENIKLTGKLDDPHWLLAPPVDCPYEMQPGENTPAKQKTYVRVMYNSEFVYFGFDCRDTRPSEIRAHVTDRDKIFQDDFVGVILDTYGDNQRSYELCVNPFGIQGDLLRVGNNEDDSFDMVWNSAAAINDSGWTAEMAIPLKSLRFPSLKTQHWSVLFLRIYPRDSRYNLSMTPIDRNNPCLTCQGRPLVGIEDIESTNSVEVLPYVLGSKSGSLEDTGDPSTPFHDNAVQGRLGAGLKYSPSPALSLEGVVNPDFSQIESDATQISINSRFALFYPERRPFFLEGADLFQNRITTFYSRTINDPAAAVKVSGKSDKLFFGYLAASDRSTPFTIPGDEGNSIVSSSLHSLDNIARARYDFAGESFVGAMFTGRTLSDAHNYVGGFDWNYLFSKNYYFRGEAFYSHTREVNDTDLLSDTRRFGSTGHDAAFNGESYGGYALRSEFLRSARDFSYDLTYFDYSPTFQAQSGFVTQSDWRQLGLSLDYSFYPTNAWLDRADLEVDLGLHYNHDGVRKERWGVLGGGLNMKGQTNIWVSVLALNQEIYKRVYFHNIPRVSISLNSQPASILSAQVQVDVGRFIHRVDSTSAGTGHNVYTDFTLKPTDKLQIELSYSRSRLSSVETGELFFDGYIARTVAKYQFTPQLLLRVIGQYNSFDKTVDFYPLISYKLNPFTTFFAGSTYTGAEFDEPYGFTQTGRQFFVKLQYLWRS